jgi:hypothetical protein
MVSEWIERIDRDDLLEQLSQDLNEISTRYKREYEYCILKHIDNAYEIGFKDGQEAQDDE